MALDVICKSDNKGCYTDSKSRLGHGQKFRFRKPSSKTQDKKGFLLISKSEFGWGLRSLCVQLFTANTVNSLIVCTQVLSKSCWSFQRSPIVWQRRPPLAAASTEGVKRDSIELNHLSISLTVPLALSEQKGDLWIGAEDFILKGIRDVIQRHYLISFQVKVLWKCAKIIMVSVHVSFFPPQKNQDTSSSLRKETVKGEWQKLEQRVSGRSLGLITSLKSRQQGMQGVKGCKITSAEHLTTNGSDQLRTWGEEPGEITKKETQWIMLLYTEGEKEKQQKCSLWKLLTKETGKTKN